MKTLILKNILSRESLLIFLGVAALSVLAQIRLPLPFTPVPVTGQTFGVTFMALVYGRRRAVCMVIGYFAVGAFGFPVFAGAKAGLTWGPTLGYLIGMIFSSMIVGYFSDRGFTNSFVRAWMAAQLGSVCVFIFGLAILSFFVPGELLSVGLLPFLPGDLYKNSLAAWLAIQMKGRK